MKSGEESKKKKEGGKKAIVVFFKKANTTPPHFEGNLHKCLSMNFFNLWHVSF